MFYEYTPDRPQPTERRISRKHHHFLLEMSEVKWQHEETPKAIGDLKT